MQKETLYIQNISCGHCVAAIERELKALSGVRKVKSDQATKQVEVEWESPATIAIIKRKLTEINYPAV